MPEVPTNITNISKGVTDLARDAAYVAVGLGVLGYQRAQVQRVELQNRLSKDFSLDQRIGEVRQGVAKGYPPDRRPGRDGRAVRRDDPAAAGGQAALLGLPGHHEGEASRLVRSGFRSASA